MNENKFDNMGNVYKQFRPSYPKEFVDYLYTEVGVNCESVIADIGSGSGILTKQLLEKGNKVYAVEPNNHMRNIAETELLKYESFNSISASAENTTLKSNSVNFVTVAQAFHWFNIELFKKECKRILTQKGKVILVWNSRNSTSQSVIECDLINRKYCPNFKGFSGGTRGETNENDFCSFFSGEYGVKYFENNLYYDKKSFIGRQLSSSYALKENDENYNDYIQELINVFDKFSVDGKIIMPNTTRCYIGQV